MFDPVLEHVKLLELGDKVKLLAWLKSDVKHEYAIRDLALDLTERDGRKLMDFHP